MAFDFKDGGAVVDTSAGDDGIVMAAPSINSPRPAPYKWSALWAYIQSKAGTMLVYDVGTDEGDIPLLGPGGKLPHAQMNLASVPLTGIPTAPTASLGTNTTQLATTAFVQAAAAALINSAPGVLDTLDELAAALGDDANFAATITTALALKAPLASPALTSTPTAPTATAGTNTTQLATTAFVQSLLNVAETTLASAATCDLATITTTRIEITGSTTITSFGSGTNRFRVLRFSGEVLLTYNATSLILPGARDIRTAVGDVALVGSDGSGNWRVVSYLRASGKALSPPTVMLSARDILRGEEGFASDFLSRTALIHDLTGAKSNAGGPGDLLTVTRAGTNAGYADRDRVYKYAAANTLRYTHDPVTGVPLGLLVEPAATNLLTYSEAADDASWTKNNATISANAAVAPDGATTADSLVEDGTAGVSHRITKGSITVTSGQPYIFSVWVKANTRSAVSVLISDGTTSWARRFDVQAGTSSAEDVASVSPATVYGMEQWSNGWWRCWVGTTMTTTTSSCQIRLHNGADTYTGDGVSGLYVWGMQFELISGLAPSSYVPTGAATATRNADAISNLTSALPGDASTRGTLFVEGSAITPTSVALVDLNNASINERVGLLLNSSSIPAAFVVDGGVTQANIAVGSALASGQTFKVAASYALNDIAASRDGGAPSTDTAATMPTVTQLQIGRRGDGSTLLHGIIRRVAWFSRDLSDAELVALTG